MPSSPQEGGDRTANVTAALFRMWTCMPSTPLFSPLSSFTTWQCRGRAPAAGPGGNRSIPYAHMICLFSVDRLHRTCIQQDAPTGVSQRYASCIHPNSFRNSGWCTGGSSDTDQIKTALDYPQCSDAEKIVWLAPGTDA